MATRRNGLWRRFVAATVVAIGLGVAWALVGGWAVSTIEWLATGGGVRMQENIEIAADGTPVISADTYSSTGMVRLSRRTLDGKEWSKENEYWLGGALLAPRRPPSRLVQLPLQWGSRGRIGGMTDGRHPPTDWYVVRDADPIGHCHFAGFDALSKLPIGYIGRNGFRTTQPDGDELFALPETNASLSSYITGTQYIDFYQIVSRDYELSEDEQPAPWHMYVVEANKLWEVDLRQRTDQRVRFHHPCAAQSYRRTSASHSSMLRWPH